MTKKNYKEVNYSIDEEELQVIISKAKGGVSKSQEELLVIFNNYLTKWVNLLYYGKYKLSDYDVREFIGLYVPDNIVRLYLKKQKLNSQGHKQVQECMRGVQYMVQRYGDEEDIRQTVNLTFMQCLSRYERRGEVKFAGFLVMYFFYMLKKNVDQFLIDQLGRKTFPLIADDDYGMGDDSSEDKTQGFHAPPDLSVEETIAAEDMDEYWVIGDTVRPPFDCLTIQERQLLKWRFVDGYKSSEIADKITEHPNTVREHFNKVRLKVAEALAED
jgi:hypothetical protein